MPLPSMDEVNAWAASAPPPAAPPPTTSLPTVNEAFSTPEAGAAHDAVWSASNNPLSRVMAATGYGASQPWENRNIGLSPDDEASLRRAGIFNDYQGGQNGFYQSSMEAILRPAASLSDMLINAPAAIAGAVTAGGRQLAAEEGAQVPDAAGVPSAQAGAAPYVGAAISGLTQGAVNPEGLQAAAELASGVTKGYYPELAEEGAVGGVLTTAAAREARAADAAAARATGALGEGEAGYYDAKPLTPENAQARTAAASQAGIEAPQPEPPPPDVHALARRIDPETFQQYDSLNAEGALHRDTLSRLGEERAASPEAVAAQGEIDTIMGRVNNVPARLTNVARDRLEAAQSRLDDILNTDTPEMAATRAQLLDADFARRELAPDVSAAYRQAREIAPDLPETMVAAEEQGPKAAEAEAKGAEPPAAEMAAQAQSVEAVSLAHEREIAVAGAAQEVQPAEFTPASVTGEKLGEPGEAVPAEGTASAPGRPGGLRAVQGTGETVTRGLSAGVEESAIERGLVNNFGDLPEYERVSMADQARQATDLIGNDYDLAKDVAMGRRAPPSGLLPESVFVGVEKRALAEGDVETLRQLATRSRLTTAATTMGQRIRTLGERDASSPVGAIQAVQAARERAYGAGLSEAKAAAVREIKAEVRTNASKPAAWEALVDSLLCKT
jgi:hypothetical protein